jgi:hypothetical protein
MHPSSNGMTRNYASSQSLSPGWETVLSSALLRMKRGVSVFVRPCQRFVPSDFA